MRGRLVIGSVAVAALAVIFVGCPGHLTDPSRFYEDGGLAGVCTTPIDVQATIFSSTCAQSGCHDATTKSNGLDMASPGLAARMLNTASQGCSGQVLLKSDLTGYFFEKMTSSSPACGLQMPLGKASLSIEQVACIRDYLASQLADGGTDGGT